MGAASIYHHTDQSTYEAFECIDVSAFGSLLEELLDRCTPEDIVSHMQIVQKLRTLEYACMDEAVVTRPLLDEIHATLKRVTRTR